MEKYIACKCKKKKKSWRQSRPQNIHHSIKKQALGIKKDTT